MHVLCVQGMGGNGMFTLFQSCKGTGCQRYRDTQKYGTCNYLLHNKLLYNVLSRGGTYLINGNNSNIISFSNMVKLITQCVKHIFVLKVAVLNSERRGH